MKCLLNILVYILWSGRIQEPAKGRAFYENNLQLKAVNYFL